MYGQVQINGTNYIERAQTFPLEVPLTVNNQVVKGSLVLPGVANFWLKSLSRDTLAAGVSTSLRFRFKLGNSDGNTWYSQGGVGGSVDRVMDTNYFGNGQFPKVLVPFIFYSASAAIQYEIEDATGAATGTPYTVVIAFDGSYLIPQHN